MQGIYPTLMLVILRESIWNDDSDSYQSSIGIGTSRSFNHSNNGRGSGAEALSIGSRMHFASRPDTETTKMGSTTLHSNLKSAGDVGGSSAQRIVQFEPVESESFIEMQDVDQGDDEQRRSREGREMTV